MAKKKSTKCSSKKSKSAKYYCKNRKALARKNKYQKKYNKKDVPNRVQLNKINRQNHKAGKSKVGDKKDVSHKKDGSKVLEKRSKNRARNRGRK